ncbi:hypothetical protein [Hymenobacter sp. GOD-10R]|uniref:hypothetical protein n=1 Tax=Hymenobacter sp. GOD-10R TaxID=3093922 RepID=UPI002D78CB70|nr:hypothetical protein [Hymenobacter sp. GOD-10R]WRQ26466.1 hypothetical protein SD425_15400 [Hymenobacter sp. GOD-10R]
MHTYTIIDFEGEFDIRISLLGARYKATYYGPHEDKLGDIRPAGDFPSLIKNIHRAVAACKGIPTTPPCRTINMAEWIRAASAPEVWAVQSTANG